MKFTTHEITTNPTSIENWNEKYRYGDETQLETQMRVAKALASVEEDNKYWYEKFLKTLVKFKEEENGELTPIGLKTTAGGRITANVGTSFKKATALNCFITGPVTNAKISYVRKVNGLEYKSNIKTPDTPDDLNNIFLTVMEQAKTLASEGGYGINFDFIRYRGSLIKGTGIEHPGVIAYMNIWDKVSECIVKGNNDGYEDTIKNHLNKKEINEIKKRMTRKGAMMGVLSVSHPDIEEFIRAKQESGMLTKFNISVLVDDKFMKAVEENDFYDLTFDGEVIKRIKAKNLYDLMMKSTYNRAEPGILFKDNMNRQNPISYLGDVNATNPCFSGDTLISVADGRNAVSIKELAKESKGYLEFPVYSARKNRKKKWKTEIKNAIAFKSGNKELIKIKLSDGNSFRCTEDHEIALADGNYIKAKDSKGKKLENFFTFKKYNHTYINTFSNAYNKQHRLIWEYYNGEKPIGLEIDHIENTEGDFLNNLQLLTKEDHDYKSGQERLGKNNGIHKIINTDEFKHNQIVRSTLSNNARYSGLSNTDLLEIGKECLIIYGEITKKNCRMINNLFPKSFSKNRFNGSFARFKEIILNNETYIEKNIPDYILKDKKLNRFEYLKNDVFVEDIEYLNIYEDVYDLTVEDNHNFYIITEKKDKFSRGVLVSNCGEIPGNPLLSTVCLLGSINLTQYVDVITREFNWAQYILDIKVFSRMLDNVCDLSNTPLPSYDWALKNIRQYGMGVNGLGSTMMMMGLKYGSANSLLFAKKIFELKENITMQTSAYLAKEKGTFPQYDKEKFINTEYFKSDKLNEDTKDLIRKYGVRNAKTTTNPPLGNSSIYCDVISNGIEPVFSLEYERKSICDWPEGLNSDNVKDILKHGKEKDFEYWRGMYNDREYYFEPHNRGLCRIIKVRDFGYDWLLKHYPDEIKNDYVVTTSKLNIDDHLNMQELAQFYLQSGSFKNGKFTKEL